ncbi:MAG: hypothetical protein D6775_02120 [Caldilineae bacterium]|nr:MAG: hypothetical protein D6775_02120 [Caldilineae bacterium]
MSPYMRTLADLLTLVRILFSLVMVWIGWALGAEGLSLAVAVLLLAWFTDLLDGMAARRAPADSTSRIGTHDAEADLSVSLGVTGYLSFSDYLPPLIGLALAALITAIWLGRSHVLAWPFYVIPYVILFWIAWRYEPAAGRMYLGYLAIILFIRRKRFWSEHLPDFFTAIRNLRQHQDT